MGGHVGGSDGRPLAGASCLVVDDLDASRLVIRRVLERAGAAVVEAKDALGLVERATAERPHVILLDVNMPGVDGLTACRSLRARQELFLTPVVIVTAEGDAATRLAALEAGADDLLEKPVSPEVLVARVRNLYLRSRAERRNEELVGKLQRYVSAPARGQAEDEREVELIEATVMFSDLRGFTAISFEHDVDRVFRAVSAVLAEQTEVVNACGGYTDKFSGDGLLAVFEGIDGTRNACIAAQRIVRWARQFDLIAFWSPPPIGLGIHHGEFLRGDLGGKTRREYTVLGHTVNVAARLCGVAEALEIKTSEAVFERVSGQFEFDPAEHHPLKGLPKNNPVYTLRVDVD